MRHPLIALVMMLLVAPLAQAENLYPDPGFEAGGTPGESHSGNKAGRWW